MPSLLLVNTNRFQTPPVIPVGLEYIADNLRRNEIEVEILDLCFEENPIARLENAVASFYPDFIGLSIRNVDNVFYFDNEFYLEDVKNLVSHIKSAFPQPVILGGSGYSIMPQEALSYLQADYGISGPGELALPYLINRLAAGEETPRVISGWEHGAPHDIVYNRGSEIDYPAYIKDDGLIGFETHKGCSEACPYCVEAKKPLIYKNPESVAIELSILAQKGYRRFHTADSEFNHDLNYSNMVLNAIWIRDLGLDFSVYLKPKPLTEKFFGLLAECGTTIVTLTVDSFEMSKPNGSYRETDVMNAIAWAKAGGLKVAVDLMTGYRSEPESSVIHALEVLEQAAPHTVGVNFIFRVYPNTEIGRLAQSGALDAGLSGKPHPQFGFLYPVFYKCLELDRVKELTGKSGLFKIEGFQKSSNYQRLEQIN